VDQRLFRYLDLHAMRSIPWRWQMNMRTGETKEGPLSDTITEFGMVNSTVAGRPYRWAYSALPTEGWFTFEGIIKHDVTTGRMETYAFPEGTYCSETVFAPRPAATSEDDGYLLTYTTDVVNDESHCAIFDAQNPADGPIARVRLPERICSGTHAYWADASTLTPA
jgi:carotenoid cleavage dioxygenase